jgi:hypothetical protein
MQYKVRRSPTKVNIYESCGGADGGGGINVALTILIVSTDLSYLTVSPQDTVKDMDMGFSKICLINFRLFVC